jgi:hypothetical protein
VPTETVLVQIITAANMAGVEEAQAGFLKLAAGAVVLGAAVAAVVIVGKAAYENYKAQETATNQLKQATDAQGISLRDLQTAYEEFKAVNAGFISDQYDTETALAAIVRSGENETDAIRILGDALDLAAIKHEAVSGAAKQLDLALAGNSKTLKELGITLDEYNAIMKDKTLTIEQRHLELLTLIESKTAQGRDVIDQTAQSQNKLTIAWQDFTTKIGPSVVTTWQNINQAASTGLGILSVYVDFMNKLAAIGPFGGGNGAAAPNTRLPQSFGRASGGPVTAGQPYMVGEQGPEPFIPATDGTIMPHGSAIGSATEIHIHIDQGAYIDGPSIDRLANLILQRSRYAPGT